MAISDQCAPQAAAAPTILEPQAHHQIILFILSKKALTEF
ncbi:MAG: hypothetical protein ACI814_001915 [Mariniblastus sp.]|jgi:hypothetical protein